MRFFATMALALTAGIFIAWLLERIWPAASIPVLLTLAAAWIYFGWREMKKGGKE